MEASGTSGMKAAINGVLNLSIVDGWWGRAPARCERLAYERAPTGVIPIRQDEEDLKAFMEVLIGSYPDLYNDAPAGLR